MNFERRPSGAFVRVADQQKTDDWLGRYTFIGINMIVIILTVVRFLTK